MIDEHRLRTDSIREGQSLVESEERYHFDINYGSPSSPPPLDLNQALAEVFRTINYNASSTHGMGYAHGVMVAGRASPDELAAARRHLHRELALGTEPVAKFTRRGDKKNYRPAGSSDDMFVRLIIGRIARLRFLDMTPYEEFVFLSARDRRIVLAERRVPAGGRPVGQLLTAFVVVAAEPDGAVRNGRLSPSIRNWVDGPEELSSPTTSRQSL
ncbi:hypothetical protein Afe04nite_18750 [Asanoa ferruginea]|uniref:hypothetical protein n=1 Tax=Asanoa ferruginea TaxID=53367 RepID=UPI0011C14E8F|nr:hypothetical protein [Asanoa ferruginea]GIF47336.1 hypothetical protein Afe04nite_18750 [Asanoa ferruginea]